MKNFGEVCSANTWLYRDGHKVFVKCEYLIHLPKIKKNTAVLRTNEFAVAVGRVE